MTMANTSIETAEAKEQICTCWVMKCSWFSNKFVQRNGPGAIFFRYSVKLLLVLESLSSPGQMYILPVWAFPVRRGSSAQSCPTEYPPRVQRIWPGLGEEDPPGLFEANLGQLHFDQTLSGMSKHLGTLPPLGVPCGVGVNQGGRKEIHQKKKSKLHVHQESSLHLQHPKV